MTSAGEFPTEGETRAYRLGFLAGALRHDEIRVCLDADRRMSWWAEGWFRQLEQWARAEPLTCRFDPPEVEFNELQIRM